ncbi:MAG: cytochrome C [Verrucomicrobiota bacterium]
MPIYEFYSPDNNKLYQFFARSLRYSDKVPLCPDGKELRMEKRVSKFAITGKAKEESDEDDPFADMSESQMESLMGEFEGEMAGMDEENPDPRMMGKFMRRMCEVTGRELPGPLEEMVGRMEKGEDPEALEEEFGDVLDDEDMDLFAKQRAKLFGKKPPLRDPQLYEFSDFLEESPATS